MSQLKTRIACAAQQGVCRIKISPVTKVAVVTATHDVSLANFAFVIVYRIKHISPGNTFFSRAFVEFGSICFGINLIVHVFGFSGNDTQVFCTTRYVTFTNMNVFLNEGRSKS